MQSLWAKFHLYVDFIQMAALSTHPPHCIQTGRGLLLPLAIILNLLKYMTYILYILLPKQHIQLWISALPSSPRAQKALAGVTVMADWLFPPHTSLQPLQHP